MMCDIGYHGIPMGHWESRYKINQGMLLVLPPVPSCNAAGCRTNLQGYNNTTCISSLTDYMNVLRPVNGTEWWEEG